MHEMVRPTHNGTDGHLAQGIFLGDKSGWNFLSFSSGVYLFGLYHTLPFFFLFLFSFIPFLPFGSSHCRRHLATVLSDTHPQLYCQTNTYPGCLACIIHLNTLGWSFLVWLNLILNQGHFFQM